MKHGKINLLKKTIIWVKKINMEKEFTIKRFTNGRGHSHLVVITEEAIEDVHIGSVIIVPYADGFKDPIKVVLQTDDNGTPLTANEKFGIVSKYIYE